MTLDRREFLKRSLGLGAMWTLFGGMRSLPLLAKEPVTLSDIALRPLGSTGVHVTRLGLGGEGVLRTWGRMREAVSVIRRALDLGITYFDSAPAYSGSLDYYGEALGADRKRIFFASKTHIRNRDGSLRLLDKTLKRLRTDHLDLWQLHDLRDGQDLERIFARDGAIRAMEEARADGRVRFTGITGHYDPQVLISAAGRYPFDTVLCPVNIADRAGFSFIDSVIPVARQNKMGVIGMKVVDRGALIRPDRGATVEALVHYALSQDVSTLIIGCSTPAEVESNVRYAQAFEVLPGQEIARLEAVGQGLRGVNQFKRGV